MDRNKLVIVLLAVLAVIVMASHVSTSHVTVSKIVTGNVDTVQPGAGHVIVGPPTVNGAFIDRTLCAATSPACGTGQALYAYGAQYHIDPAYALAFFWHESNFGRSGVAAQTRGLGNIRCTAGYQCIDGFRAYPSWAAGYQDWYALITWYVTDLHKRTIEQIVPTYAPPTDDNDTPAYIHAVLSSVATWHKEVAA